jgi:hypothetical protein
MTLTPPWPVTNLLEAWRNGCSTEKPWREANGVRAMPVKLLEAGRADALQAKPIKQKGRLTSNVR